MDRILTWLPSKPSTIFVRYGVTGLIVSALGLTQFAVYSYSGASASFIFLPGIFAAGLVFDRGSAFFATFFATALGSFPFLYGANISSLVPLGLFLAVGLGTAAFSEKLRKLMDRLAAAERAQGLFLDEIDHRAKNNMMIMASLLRFHAKASQNDETKAVLAAASSRISILADLHNYLRPLEPNRIVNLRGYLEDLLGKMEALRSGISVSVTTEPLQIDLPESQALPVSIIVNELVTNSLKHAFPGRRKGMVEVRVEKNTESLEVLVSDNGIGCPEDAREGVGSKLVNAMVAQLGGTLSRQPTAEGCHIRMFVPLSPSQGGDTFA